MASMCGGKPTKILEMNSHLLKLFKKKIFQSIYFKIFKMYGAVFWKLKSLYF